MAEIQTQSLKTNSPRMRGLKWVVESIIICGIIYFMIRSVIGFLAPESLWTPTQQSERISGTPTAQNSGLNFDFAIDPFHRDALPVLSVAVGEDAPETTLSLKLFGRRAGPQGSAIIETPDRVQGVFRVGDEIIDGVTLKAVNPEFIVLSRSGTLERLTFEREREGLLGSKDKSPQSVSSETVSNRTTDLSQISPADLLSAVTFKRISEPGKTGRVKGFEVRSTSNSIKLEAFGLRNGDIITAIGQEDLTQGRPDMRTLISQLTASNSVQLNVLRGKTNLVIDLGRP